jgi:riboflavin kinase/FMN adenylyltransferase
VKVFEGLEALRPGALRDPVCTVGVFDGVHRGHRQVLYELVAWARATGGESCAMTFSRHPAVVLGGLDVPPILSVRHRLVEFERHGVDAAVVLEFESVRELSPEAFLREVLVGRLGCRRLLLGYDSRIGKGGAGDARTLPPVAAAAGVELRIASRVTDRAGRKISSSAIREAIRTGDLETAANMLGRPHALYGRVVRGAGRGRSLGTATANLDVGGELLPPDGVYLVRVFRRGVTAPGVANLGVRPTFGPGGLRTLEVHVPGWEGDLLGEELEVRLVRKIRDERAFESPDALKAQVAADLAELRRAVAAGEI